MRVFLRSKIHQCYVTEKNLNYVGSIVIDSELLELVDMAEYEQVSVYNVNNGNRWETYVISGKPGSGIISSQGPAARLCEVGDCLVIVAFDYGEALTKRPKMITVDKDNRLLQSL